jgi:exopolysaccharide biosynthesis polyprenyl glycosylphosphotransferase
MIILGNKYQITKQEETEITQKVKNIHYLDINDEEIIIKELKKFLDDNDIEFIVLNLEKDLSFRVKSYLEELDYDGIKIMLFSEFTSKFLNKCFVEFNEMNFDVLQSIHHDETRQIKKRLFDIAFSSAALLCLSPVFLIVSLLIKVKSPNGPIFFGHQRIGKDGKFFRVYKFRTMVPDAEKRLKELLDKDEEARKEFEQDFKLKNDPRIISGVGHFLRKSSLDELPQFFNSLIGNMSVVGPRPIVEDEIEKYGKYAKKLLSVKPGVTGLWQVSGRNDIDYSERVSLDMEYIDNNTLVLDLKIIIKTVQVMIFRQGAY